MKRKILYLCILLLMLCLGLSADNQVVSSSRVTAWTSSQSEEEGSWQSYVDQLGVTSQGTMDYDLLILLRKAQARGQADYPVTIGDTYSLTYVYNQETVTVPVEISHSMTVNIPSVGSFDRRGKTFAQFKEEVEDAVSTRYSYSSPNLSLQTTGAFTVMVSGATTTSRSVDVWGLSRLSDMALYASDNASTRDVTVIKEDGTEIHYDLYKARREGDTSQDPYLAPGDRVVFKVRGTTVLVYGAVARSGTYQIEDQLTLKDFVETYAMGLSTQADVSKTTVTRYVNGSYQEIRIGWDEDFILQDGDMIKIPPYDPPVGSVMVEGALQTDQSNTGSTNTVMGQTRGQYFYRFIVGETLESMLVDMSAYFTAFSDLDGAMLTRDGRSQSISIRNILYGNDPDGDIILQNGDKITIPFSTQVVTVNGAVNSSGTYGYVPGKDVSYYVNLAGGLASSAKGLNRYTLYNSYGEKISKNSPITAGTTIEMESSSFFQNDLAVVASVLAIVTAVVGIVASVVDLASSN